MRKLSLLMMMLMISGFIFAGEQKGEEENTESTKDSEKKVLTTLKKVWNGEYAAEEDEDEEKAFPLTMGLDLVSRYVWRGQTYNTSPSIQPFLEYSVGSDKIAFTLGTWSSWAFANNNDGSTSEIDLYGSLSAGIFSIFYTDYFYPGEATINSGSDNFFQFRNKSNNTNASGHTHEIGISLGSDDFPLSAVFTSNVGGGGDLIIKDGEVKQGFATYVELDYAIRDGINVFVGAASDRGSGWHIQDPKGKGYKFMVVNVGLTASKEIELGKVKIPLSASLIVNPDARNVFFVAAIGLSN